MKTAYPYKLEVGQEILGRVGKGIVKYRVTRVIDDTNIEVEFVSLDVDSESKDAITFGKGDYTECETCTNIITWEEYGRNAGQCQECSPSDLIEETNYLEEDEE